VILPNLGVHRTGPDRAGERFDGLSGRQIALWVSDKFGAAFVAAKVERSITMMGMM